MPHAGKRRLNHELVCCMAAGHKAKWGLHFHVIEARVPARVVCSRGMQVSIELREFAAKRRRGIAIVRRLMANAAKSLAKLRRIA